MKLLLSFLTVFGCGYSQSLNSLNTEHYSLPPSNLPVKKIYVHGRPVYVRQTFVNYLHDGDFQATGGYSNGMNAVLFQAPPQTPAYVVSPPQFIRPAPPLMAPMPAIEPTLARQVTPSGYNNAVVENKQKSIYPLPECYTNDYGFMCCNPALEKAINRGYNELKKSRKNFSTCNIQQIALKIQAELEKTFNQKFETIVGVGDYASKLHFYSNYICKVERDHRFILAYGTPHKGVPDNKRFRLYPGKK